MTAANPQTTGQILRKLAVIRKASGLSNQAMARRMGISPSAARQIDKSVREARGLHLETFVRYCRALNVRLAYQVETTDQHERTHV